MRCSVIIVDLIQFILPFWQDVCPSSCLMSKPSNRLNSLKFNNLCVK